MLPSARTTLEQEPEALGHNAWARRPAEVVARVLSWIDRELGAVTPGGDDDEVVDA
jgi:hypothetical protein